MLEFQAILRNEYVTISAETCRNSPTNDFKSIYSAIYECHTVYEHFCLLSLFYAGMFYKVSRLILEGFKLVLIVVGSVRPFIFHNIHHGASWIMQKLQCDSYIYNSSSSHWWKLHLWVTQTENYTWHEAIYMNIPSHYKIIVSQWELSRIRIIIISIISSKRIYISSQANAVLLSAHAVNHSLPATMMTCCFLACMWYRPWRFFFFFQD